MKFRRTYSFAFWSSFYLTLVTSFIVALCYYFLFNFFGFFGLILSSVILFIIAFLIIQYRAEHFIYRRIKKIYDDVSLSDSTYLNREFITTDMETLTKNVKHFIEGKRTEIQDLTDRDSFRREFLGNVAHELKTPLFTVQGYILTLLEGAAEDKKILYKYLKRANKGVERLSSVVKDLDMISKLEAKDLKIKIESFNLLELVQSVFDLFEMRAKKRNITLKFDRIYEFPIFAMGDVERIEQVLINLIVNSIEYGKIDGITRVSIDSYSQNKWVVKVIDDGEGIRQEHLSRLFERFYRVDQSRSREEGGSGLGLSIVKHILEAHGQVILLKSDFGKGSEFSFTLEKVK